MAAQAVSPALGTGSGGLNLVNSRTCVFPDAASSGSAEYILECSAGASGDIAAATSAGTIIILDPLTLKVKCSPTGLHRHTDSAVAARWSPKNENTLFSASLDGSIACLDLRVGSAVASLVAPPVPSSHVAHLSPAAEAAARRARSITPPVSALAVGCGGDMVAAGTGLFVRFFDVRKSSSATSWPLLGEYTESHSATITCMHFHPTQASTLLCADEAGLVNIFNTAVAGEADALSGNLVADGGISSLGVFGPAGACVYATTQDLALHVWNLGSGEAIAEHKNLFSTFSGAGLDVSHLVDCTYDPASQGLTLWAGNHSGALLSFDVQGAGLAPLQSLSKGHTDDVRCLARCTPAGAAAPVFVSGAEDGSLAVWSAADLPKVQPSLPARAAKPGKSPSSRGRVDRHSRKRDTSKPF